MPENVPPAGPASTPSDAVGGTLVPRRERILLWAILLVLFAVRAVYATRVRFDTDEPQHMHVAWEWTQGHVQYRDFFDNHAPLFHLLFAPFVSAVGERADVLVLGRFAMFPCFAAALLLTWSIGKRCFSSRVGAWAAVFLGLHMEFFSTSLQFRTDDLWTVTWLAAVRVFVGGSWSARRAFAGGLVAGLSFGVSMKTALLAAGLAAGAAVTGFLFAPWRESWTRRRVAAGAACALAGALVVPGTIAVAFASVGAWHDLVYCTVGHNALRPDYVGPLATKVPILLACLAGLLFAARDYARRRALAGDTGRQLLVLLQSALAASVLYSVWPTQTSQDALPHLPFGVLLGAAFLVPLSDRLGARLSRGAAGGARAGTRSTALLAVVAVVLAGRLLWTHPLGRDDASPRVADMARVLHWTDRTDYVMDPKGDAVFRERPYYWVIELFTRWHVKRGEIPDDVPERLVATGTAIAFGDLNAYTPKGRAFIGGTYLHAGRTWVAGRVLTPPAAGGAVEFDVAIPGRYAVVSDPAPARGALDGLPYDGPRTLAAGRHAFAPAAPTARLAVAWAKAVERGFDPFAPGEAHP